MDSKFILVFLYKKYLTKYFYVIKKYLYKTFHFADEDFVVCGAGVRGIFSYEKFIYFFRLND